MAVLFAVVLITETKAVTFANGDFITYGQHSWGDSPTPTDAAGLLVSEFDNIYPLGTVRVGGALIIEFSSPSAVLTYLPAVGVVGSLAQSQLNPTSTASGAFGGQVLALALNVDFADAGVLPGAHGVRFGDLELRNFTMLPLLNGLSVREFLGVTNTSDHPTTTRRRTSRWRFPWTARPT